MNVKMKICMTVLGTALCMVSQTSMAQYVTNFDHDPPKCTYDGKEFSQGASQPGDASKVCSEDGTWEDR